MTEHSVENAPTLTAPNVAIVGFAEGHYNEAPFDDPDWELWGINRLHVPLGGKRWTRWFNLHDLEKFHGKDQEHLEFLRAFPGPVYLRPQDVGKYDIPNAVPFPADWLAKNFVPYFNNTISWLLAFAIAAKPEGIGVFGVDMAQDDLMQAEYAAQRPSCEYFLGIATGRGIALHLPKGSDLLKTTHLYGFEDADIVVSKYLNRLQEVGSRKEQIKVELAQLENQKVQMVAAINQMDGAMQDVQYWLRNWRPQDLGEEFVTQNGHKETVDSAGKETNG